VNSPGNLFQENSSMKRVFLPTLVTAVLFGSALPALAAPAGQVPDKTAIKILYTRLCNAMKNKDVRAIEVLGTSDFTHKGPDGKVKSAKEAMAEVEQGLRSMKKINDVKADIRSVAISGKKAVVTVNYTMSAVIVQKGKPADMSMKSTSKDTLVKTPQGWKFKSVSAVTDEASINGQRIPGTPTPSKAVRSRART
jgi:ketosteroid isomerase-like protein